MGDKPLYVLSPTARIYATLTWLIHFQDQLLCSGSVAPGGTFSLNGKIAQWAWFYHLGAARVASLVKNLWQCGASRHRVGCDTVFWTKFLSLRELKRFEDFRWMRTEALRSRLWIRAGTRICTEPLGRVGKPHLRRWLTVAVPFELPRATGSQG